MDIERKLVSDQIIAEVQPIEGADAIEKVRVNGWWVVAKKGEFQPGDACVYFEIDSVIPCVPQFEFLRKGCYLKRDWLPEGEGCRLRTIKLRGQVSQGLVVKALEDESVRERVVKFDPPVPACLAGMARGNWPEFLRRTDQDRCQNIPREIREAYERGDIFEVTTKLDGSSCTFAWKDGEFYVCSRNVNLKTDQEGNSFVGMAKKLGIAEKLEKFGMNVAIQGELMGPGIQGNRENFSEHRFFAFDVFDIESQKYLPAHGRELDLTEMLGIEHVPVIRTGRLESPEVADLLLMADGPSINNPVREGVVFKRIDGQFSFKAISNRFLMEQKD